jgi:hypothetical protein
VLISLGRLLRCNVPVAFAAAPNFAGSSTDANPLSVHHWRSRRIAVLSVCRRGEAQELRGSFRRRSFGGNGHAWVDDIERGEIIRSDGSAVDGLRRHCSVLLCSRCDLEIQIGRGSGGDLSHCGVDGLRGGSLVRAVAITAMRVHFDISALKDTKWYEYALRFFFGGAITVITGVLANRYGPVFGGLFLAFPAVFPASATLIEKHEREKKRKAGIAKTPRGREAAALDARGAAIGSIGLIGFAFTTWRLLPIWSGALALFGALVVWTTVSILIWRLRRHRLFLPRGRTSAASHAPVSTKG